MSKRYIGVTGLIIIFTLIFSSFVVLAQGPEPGNIESNVILQNTGSATGNVVITYYKDGAEVTHRDIQLASHAVTEIQTANETALGDGWSGSAILSSDTSMAAIVSLKHTNVPGDADGKTQAAYNGTTAGAAKLYFPSVWKTQYQVSQFTVQNTDGSQASVTIQVFGRDGSDFGTKTDTIPAYSQKTYDLGTLTTSGDMSTFTEGAVIVTSASANLVGASLTHWGNRAIGYQALTDGNKGTTLFAPSHFRYTYGATVPRSSSSEKMTLFSVINLQNTSTTQVANVTAKYYTRGDSSGVPVYTTTFTIPAGSAFGLNTKNGGNKTWTDFDALVKGSTAGVPDWDGSVTIVSDQNLVGTGMTGWDSKGYQGAYALVTENDSANEIFVPAQYLLDFGSGIAQWSSVNVMNVGSSTIAANDLTIQYVDTDGNAISGLTFTGTSLPSSASSGLSSGAAVGINTKNGGDFSDNSAFDGAVTDGSGKNYLIGGIYVSAPVGSKLVGVANIIYSNRASVYNAVPGQ